MKLFRRILSSVLVFVGFAMVAYGMYITFIAFTPRAAIWPVVAIGIAVLVIGLLVQVGPLRHRIIAAALGLIAMVLFVLGYPLYGLEGGSLYSLLWIPATALVAAAVLIARGRSWWTMLAPAGLVLVYAALGLLIQDGPIGWWPINIRLPGGMMDGLRMFINAFWPVQVFIMGALVALTAIAGAAIDPGRGKGRGAGRLESDDADGTMDG